jgi:transposase-like protein
MRNGGYIVEVARRLGLDRGTIGEWHRQLLAPNTSKAFTTHMVDRGAATSRAHSAIP